MNKQIETAITIALVNYQNQNLDKATYLYKINFYKHRNFEDISKSDIPYIEDFIPYVENKAAKEFLIKKIS